VKDGKGGLLGRRGACLDEGRVLKVRVTDTCPKKDNLQWCSGWVHCHSQGRSTPNLGARVHVACACEWHVHVSGMCM
jgi:hypothetical protein